MLKVQLDFLASRVVPASLDLPDQEDQLVFLDRKVLPVCLVAPVVLVRLVPPVQVAPLDQLVSRVVLEQLDPQV